MMRKIILTGLSVSLLIIIAATPALADFAGVSDPLGGKFGTVGEIISALLTPIFALAAMLALLFLIWGGIRYMMSRGDPKAVDAARSTITSAVIGLLIVLLSATIFFIISTVFKIKIFGFESFPTVYAQGGVDIGQTVNLGTGPIGAAFKNFGELFTNIVRLALFTAGLVFFAMITWGGFRYLNAGGDPKGADAARQTLTNAGIGLLIVVVSFIIIEIITKLAGKGGIF